ncbi:MAG: hypothetical protein ACQERC_10800 [Bacteroidota bacterium]
MKTGLFTLSFLVLILYSCKKEQPQLNNESKDPCDCANEVSADFEIWEGSSQVPNPRQTLTDTTYKDRTVEFRALEENAVYTWYIGADVETEQVTWKYFSDQWANQDIPITLVVEKEPNNVCFPEDDGYDSITKTFHISDYWQENTNDVDLGPIEGTYRVKSEHLSDSFDVEFYADKNFQGEIMFNIVNYNGEGSNCIDQARITGSNYRQVWTTNGTGSLVCDALRGYIHNRLDGVTEMHFSFGSTSPNDPDYDYYERTYLGRKLN